MEEIIEQSSEAPKEDKAPVEKTEKSITELAGIKPDNEKDPKESLIVDLKRDLKESKKLLSEMSQAITQVREDVRKGTISKAEAQDEFDELAERHNVDPAFAKELSKLILSKSELSTKSETEELRHSLELGRAKEVNNALVEAFDAAIAENPEFSKIANKNAVLKYVSQVVLPDENESGKSMVDILKDLYGEQIKGEVEGYSSQAKNTPDKKDFKKPTEDDFKELSQKAETTGEVDDDYFTGLLERSGHILNKKK